MQTGIQLGPHMPTSPFRNCPPPTRRIMGNFPRFKKPIVKPTMFPT